MGDLSEARILIADDEPSNVTLLERLLGQAGYRTIRSTTDARAVPALYDEFRPDLILLDLMMPHLDGVAVMERLAIPPDEYVPVLILTADVTSQARDRALAAGAKDFLTKPFDRTEVLLRIKNLLDTRFLYRQLDAQNRSLEQIVAERTERLLQSEKLATMGSLLAGVAHELNNPLAVVMGQATLLQETVKDGPIVARAAKINAAAERCARIVRNFLSLARQRPTERGVVQLNPIVHEALELLAYELRTDGVEITLQLAEGLPPLWADGHQLHQVLVNLLTNAHHAVRRAPAPRQIAVTTALDGARSRVRLTIADSGPGVPAEVRDKIFEPFFTTKPTGEGTGLGLSLCRGIVADHGGSITLDPAAARGAVFVIELPPSTRTAAAAAGETGTATAAVSPRRILVVDDEREIGELLLDVLRAAGHQVDIAGDGAVALERLARERYDLIVSDTKMPRVDGIALFQEIGRRFPALRGRIVFITGDALDRAKREFLESTGAPFLMKPFDLAEARRLVQRMLATAAPGAAS